MFDRLESSLSIFTGGILVVLSSQSDFKKTRSGYGERASSLFDESSQVVVVGLEQIVMMHNQNNRASFQQMRVCVDEVSLAGTERLDGDSG